jgi:hypothetical protein
LISWKTNTVAMRRHRIDPSASGPNNVGQTPGARWAAGTSRMPRRPFACREKRKTASSADPADRVLWFPQIRSACVDPLRTHPKSNGNVGGTKVSMKARRRNWTMRGVCWAATASVSLGLSADPAGARRQVRKSGSSRASSLTFIDQRTCRFQERLIRPWPMPFVRLYSGIVSGNR